MTLSIPPSIQCQTEAACRLITRVTGDTLRAIHLYGSAVAGGLKPNSDIDLLVTICQPLTEAQRATLMQELLALSSPPGASGRKTRSGGHCRALFAAGSLVFSTFQGNAIWRVAKRGHLSGDL
ncbi:aminoglycoside-resistance protein [Salmonella enterica subsp. enterica serovar Typhimurium]|nr:aminoglycoside-resistance protein [Salmonella enterica subsp. enterica serovar Typhimurium]